jgi:hypothetical protein
MIVTELLYYFEMVTETMVGPTYLRSRLRSVDSAFGHGMGVAGTFGLMGTLRPEVHLFGL